MGTSVDGGEKIIIVFFEFARMIIIPLVGFGRTSLHLDGLIRLFYATEADPGTGRVYYSCMESKEKREKQGEVAAVSHPASMYFQTGALM